MKRMISIVATLRGVQSDVSVFLASVLVLKNTGKRLSDRPKTAQKVRAIVFANRNGFTGFDCLLLDIRKPRPSVWSMTIAISLVFPHNRLAPKHENAGLSNSEAV